MPAEPILPPRRRLGTILPDGRAAHWRPVWRCSCGTHDSIDTDRCQACMRPRGAVHGWMQMCSTCQLATWRCETHSRCPRCGTGDTPVPAPAPEPQRQRAACTWCSGDARWLTLRSTSGEHPQPQRACARHYFNLQPDRWPVWEL